MIPPELLGMPPPSGSAPYLIFGDDIQVLQVHLQPGETVTSEPGTLCYCSPTVELDGPPEGFWGGLTRMLTGEKLVHRFVNRGQLLAFAAFSASHPGKILAVDLRQKGNLVCQPGAYLTSLGDVRLAPKAVFLELGLLGSDGVFLQKLHGTGTAFVQGGGGLVEKVLLRGEVLRVNVCCLLAISDQCMIGVEQGGNFQPTGVRARDMYILRITGPGTVYLQTLPLCRLTNRIFASATGRRDAGASPAHPPALRALAFLLVLLLLLAVLHGLVIILGTALDDNHDDL